MLCKLAREHSTDGIRDNSAPVNNVPVAPSTATATPTASPTHPPFLGSFKMDESVNPWKVNREFDF